MVIAVTTLVLVALAVGVVVAVVMRCRPSMRRVPMKEWLPSLFPAPQDRGEASQKRAGERVKPRTVSLRQFMNDTAVEGNAYAKAEHIPGYEQLEHLDQVAKQWENQVQHVTRLQVRKTHQKVSH